MNAGDTIDFPSAPNSVSLRIPDLSSFNSVSCLFLGAFFLRQRILKKIDKFPEVT